MPDISSAPGVPAPTGLYPQPPQQQPGLASNPGQALDLLRSIQQNYALQQELKARAAIGQAYQGALQPDGTLDPERLRAGLADPAASWMLPDAMTHVLGQQRAQFDLRATQDQATRQLLGSLPEKASREDVFNYAAQLVRIGVPPALVTGWLNGAPRDSKGFKDWVANTRNSALSPAELSSRTEGPPGPLGERTSVSIGQANRAGPQGMPVSLPPGTGEAQKAEAESGQNAAIALQNAANEVPNQRTQLDLMRQDLATARSKFGPTAGYEKTANIIANRVLGFHPTMTPQEIASLESFDKVGRQIAMTQAGSLHATDATLSTALGANPNTNLSALGSEGIINMLHGNTDAIAVKAREWNKARRGGVGPDQFYRWSDEFNRSFDPRVFQFMRMAPDQQATLLNSVPDKQAFWDHLREADKRGWITLPPAPREPGAPKDNSRPTTGEALRSLPPDVNAAPPKPPVPNVKLGRHTDGSPRWYIEDQTRPGKYLEVKSWPIQ